MEFLEDGVPNRMQRFGALLRGWWQRNRRGILVAVARSEGYDKDPQRPPQVAEATALPHTADIEGQVAEMRAFLKEVQPADFEPPPNQQP